MALTPGQQQCVDTLDRPLVVAAGAGSGKTFTLTKRIVNAMTSGYVDDIDQICAITFTKKAAGELKSRIKAELRACGLKDQALRADEAWVSTIHGMCARILRAHAIELGIDPAFTVVEGAQVGAYMDEAIDIVLAEAESARESAAGSSSISPAALDALFREYPARSAGGLGTSVEGMLGDLVGAASLQARGSAAFVLPEASAQPRAIVAQAVAIVEGVFAGAQSAGASAKRDEWLATTEELLGRARDALGLMDGEPGAICSHRDALRAIAPFKLAKTFGSKEFRAQVDGARAELAACTMQARLGAALPHLQVLVQLAERVMDVFAQLKRADGAMDNCDLLVFAARAIEEHPAIAAQYADKFSLMMVDEFQDTDQMQVDMIRRLAGEGARRLCTVGDAQQSIYRFRGADVSVYRRHLESLRVRWPDSVIQLSDNFRSHRDVLSFVDCVFGQPDMFGGEFMSLSAKRDEARVKAPFLSGGPRIVVQHTSRPYRGVKTERGVQVAAERIADAFAELHAEGHAPGDMVILLGRMRNADVYARALRGRGLPCVVSGGSVFAGTLEANAVERLVRVIANPRDTDALFNVLTGPFFSLTAGDVLVAGGTRGFWKATAELAGADDGALSQLAGAAAGDGVSPQLAAGIGDGVSPQLACALRVMARARAAIGREPVARIAEDVFVESGWLARLQAQGAEGLAAAANVYKALRMVKSLEQSGADGPASVARRFGDELVHSKEAPGALSVSGGDSVRIMTIHASKGLEFPIVAVAEMKDRRAGTSKLVASSIGGSVYVSLDLGRTLDDVGNTVDTATLSHLRDDVLGLAGGEDELAAAVVRDGDALCRRLAMQAFEAAGDEEEAKRLLYVALTRAKEALVVSMAGKRTKGNPVGAPDNAMAGIFTALDPTGSVLGESSGRSAFGFGGTMPAIVDHWAMEAEEAEGSDDGAGGGGPAGHGAGAGDSCAAESGAGGTADPAGAGGTADPAGTASDAAQPDGLFTIPAAEARPSLQHETYRPLREGVFSYSSISDAAHEGDVLDRLADAHAVSVDACAGGPGRESGDAGSSSGAASTADDPWTWGGTAASFDDDFWDFDVSAAFDEDRATDLGTAFHRLAQYAVVARGPSEPLAMPGRERVEALSRTCNLDADQRIRLAAALERWFGCRVARDMAALPSLAAEVPFFVKVPASPETGATPAFAFLEGEIDLLGFDASGMHAHVVDYKTGGHGDEADDDLRRKHVLQAACYAYAIMQQGVREVDAAFVRVERPRSDDPAEPQCVRYRFREEDLPELGRAIARAYAQAL